MKEHLKHIHTYIYIYTYNIILYTSVGIKEIVNTIREFDKIWNLHIHFTTRIKYVYKITVNRNNYEQHIIYMYVYEYYRMQMTGMGALA